MLGLPYDRVHGFFASRVELPSHPVFWADFARTLFELIETELVAFGDALDTVAELGAAGVLLAVASSSPRERLDRTLRRAGLERAFAVTVAGDEVEHGKPAPDMYLAAASRLGADPRDWIAVEDTAPGVASGLAAGMTVVGVGRTAADRELIADAHVVVDRLSAAGVLGARVAAA